MTPLRFLMSSAIAISLMAAQAAFAQERAADHPQTDELVSKVNVHSPRESTDSYSILIIRLKYADCHEIESLLNSTYPQSMTFADQRTNTVIFSSPKAKHAEVTQLIDQVDRPAQQGPAGPKVERVRILHRKANDLANQLMRIYSNRDLRVGFDQGRGWILLRGSDTQVESAREVLKTLDTPAGTANIEFAFLRASLSEQNEVTLLPADLKNVTDELPDVGRISLLGRLSTIAVEGDAFSIEATDTTKQTYEVQGELISATEDGSVRIRLQARMFNADAWSKKKPNAEGNDNKPQERRKANSVDFDIETTVLTRRGDYVVLGSAPTGWSPGETAILVLHVRESR